MRMLIRLLAKIYFSKIEVKGTFPKYASFYVSNHRNGVVDGLVILSIFKQKMITVIGKNLTKTRFSKFIFRKQLKIYRYPENMAEMRHNKKELSRIRPEIENGTSVLMFPEGTSHLGKGLLEISEGVAHVVSSLSERKIIPIGLHYEKGWSFRSKVFVHIGEPVSLVGNDKKKMTVEIKSQLERVYDDHYEFNVPKRNRLLAFSLFPIVLLFFVTNLLALIIPYFVAKKFADDNNVITLWRILSGVPSYILQSLMYIVFFIWNPWLLVGYLFITLIGFFTYRTWKDAAGID